MRTRPRQLVCDRLSSPLGEMLVVSDATGSLYALDWLDCTPRIERLLECYYGPVALACGAGSNPAIATLGRYFDGELTAIDSLPVATAGSDFQRAVWHALRAIPPGHTATYGELAAALGRASAARAVGQANGANPVSVVIPCHRLLGADRRLTGYAGGLARKRWLLAHEGVAAPGPHRSEHLSSIRISLINS